jgi:hypothetical protein
LTATDTTPALRFSTTFGPCPVMVPLVHPPLLELLADVLLLVPLLADVLL